MSGFVVFLPVFCLGIIFLSGFGARLGASCRHLYSEGFKRALGRV
jgi:hypothetical protein